MVSAVGVAVTHAVVVTHSRVAVVALAAAVVAVGVARASSLAPRCHGNTDTHQHAAVALDRPLCSILVAVSLVVILEEQRIKPIQILGLKLIKNI